MSAIGLLIRGTWPALDKTGYIEMICRNYCLMKIICPSGFKQKELKQSVLMNRLIRAFSDSEKLRLEVNHIQLFKS